MPFEPLTEAEAIELAGELLASSTIERYSRTLTTSVSVGRLMDMMYADPTQGEHFLSLARRYWAELIEADGRSGSEVVVAALLFALSQTGVPGVERFIAGCAVSRRPSARWIAGLARELLSTGSTAILFDAGRIGDEASYAWAGNESGDSIFAVPADITDSRSRATSQTERMEDVGLAA